jgi:hypothetical protein
MTRRDIMPMDRQAIFTKAYLGLKAQNFERSMAIFGAHNHAQCAYRGENGMKCALGHCIPDEQYKPYFEGLAPTNPNAYGSKEFPEYAERTRKAKEIGAILGVETESDSFFLMALQSIHDKASDTDQMKDRLVIFAGQNGLTVPQDS